MIASSSPGCVWSPAAASGCASASTTTTAPPLSALAGIATDSSKSGAGRYDRELKEAWERYFLPVGEDDDQGAEEDILRMRARERFAELDRNNLAPIRRDVREGWIARGSLHGIADRLEIGWHSQWVEHLRDRLGEVKDDPSAGAAA